MNMEKIELLAPAGNLNILKAAVDNGADAIYLGGENFSARAYADNFTNEEIVEGIKYAHVRGAKVYVSINTLVYDDEINEEERIIENLCLKLLLQQQPVARDLRVISSALKMITDMERIGDQAADISEVTLHLIDAKYKRDMEHIRKMAAETTYMVVQSVEAYVEKDEEKAKEVIAHDDIIDDLFIKSREDVISLIRSNPEEGACATDLLMIAKYFERIGDHACNIAEWVIFSITGEHKKK